MTAVKATHRRASPTQSKAIEIVDGPLLIIAGPGSGKTFTLVERIAHIVQTKRVEPKNFLVVTFTEKAAKELRTRISNKMLELGIKWNVNEMLLGTFHSVCLKLLEDNREFTRLRRNYVLMDQFDQQYFFYHNLKTYASVQNLSLLIGDPRRTSKWQRAESLCNWINKVTEELIPVNKLMTATEPEMKALGDAYQIYQQQLEQENALDFSTIQLESLRLVETRPIVQKKLQQQIQYMMVDEYQDTNTIQEKLLFALMSGQKNLCVVGDDDQGLYRFRGATIRNILEFTKNFAPGECKEVRLETNYRSQPDIVNFYNEWMDDADWEEDGKKFRFDKRIVPEKRKFPEHPSVLRLSAPFDEQNESYDAWYAENLKFLLKLRESGKLSDWNQVVFLFRSVKGDQARGLSKYLESNGIPVYSPRSNVFFDREEVRLAIGALLFMFRRYRAIRQWDDDVELPIWEYYDEGCFAAFAEQLQKPENRDLLKFCQERAASHDRLSSATDYGFLGLLYQLLKFPLFSRYMGEAGGKSLVDERPMRNLSTLTQLLAKFEYLHHVTVLTPDFLDKNLNDLFNNYMRYLMAGGISEYEDDAEFAPRGCVSFMTIHQSKGLEFPIVMVDSLNAVPRKQYSEIDEILEDKYSTREPFEPIELTKNFDFKRLYYTAFSRAQNLLVLTCPIRERHGRTPSKYFNAHFKKVPDWKGLDLLKLDLAHVKSANIKTEYSFTGHINIFENCAQQYRFFKEFKFNPVRTGPIIFGTLVHETIEDIHKAYLRGEGEQVNEEKIRDWFKRNYQNISDSQRVYLNQAVQNKALEHVLRYYERERANFDRLKDAEVEVSLVKDDYILTGKIDLIRGESGTVEIIDFKSENKPDLETERHKLDRYRRQLEVYAHIVEERFGNKVSKMHLYYTAEEDGNPFVTFDRADSNITRTITEIDQVVARIETRDFAIGERPLKACKNCDMRSHCDGRYPKAS